jgi:hypothetical protein
MINKEGTRMRTVTWRRSNGVIEVAIKVDVEGAE